MALALASSASPATAQPAGPFDPGQPAPAEVPAVSPAEQAFSEGRALLEAGQLAEACARFELSLRLDPDASGTLLNLGLCNQRLGKTATALAWFRRAQFRAAETSMAANENAAKAYTFNLAVLVPTVRVELTPQTPAASTVLVDGREVADVDLARLELDPGPHVIELRAPGRAPVRRELTLRDGDRPTVTLGEVATPARAVLPTAYVDVDRGRSRRIAAYVLGGTGLALWGGSLALALAAKHEADSSEHPEDWRHWTQVARFGGTSMFLVGTAAIATGVYLYVKAPGIERTAIAPAITGDALGVSVHGAF